MVWYGKIRNDKIRNECFKKRLCVTSLGAKFRKTCLRWFRHLQHRPSMTLEKKSLTMEVGRPQRKKIK